MRITIDLDSAGVSGEGPAAEASAVGTVAQDAGAAPESTAAVSSTADDSANAGGPPQWLLDAVNKAMVEAGESITADVGQAEHGGAGPA